MITARFIRRRLPAIDLGRRIRLRPSVEFMEARSLLSVTVGPSFAGVAFGQNDCNCEPPDSIVATGPNNVVEMVNTELAIYFYCIHQRQIMDVMGPHQKTYNLLHPSVHFAPQNGVELT